ncbi:putative tRNA (cytidine(32)/guanosine(34)-2'-O)-methyltransferase [Thoreauomyces humboldtii]|nr:putative tRNA (cytidine(32)/guanosine(34)-2'-O)-methyltransferase [Thoreauomyces humboldtii]
MLNPLLDFSYGEGNELKGLNRVIVPFLACGDLSGFDSDQTYNLGNADGEEYKLLQPVQMPIRPPYASYLEKKRGAF